MEPETFKHAICCFLYVCLFVLFLLLFFVYECMYGSMLSVSL